MKKILLFVIVLISESAFSQTSGVLNNNKTEVLKSVSEIKAFGNNNATVIFIPEGKKGGKFFKYNGTLTVDNAIIFADKQGNKWKRDVPEYYIKPEWWGAVGDGVTDDKPAFDAALEYYKNNTDKIAYMQLGLSSGRSKTYCFYDTIRIDFNAEIKGGVNTSLVFRKNSAGLKLRSSEKKAFIPTIYLSNIYIKQEYSYETNAAKEIGIEINCIAHLKDIIVENFQGNGIVLWGNAETSPPTNCDLSTLDRVLAASCRNNGFLIYGADANIIDFKDCQAIGCGAAGFLDNSFLGNSYINCQTASCSSPELKYQKSLCKYKGLGYYALHNKNRFGEKNKLGKPDVSTKDWALLPDQGWLYYKNILEYHVDSFYQAGGGFLLDVDNIGSQNQYGTLTNCYSELDCPPSYWSYKSMAVGGNITSIRSGLKIGGWFNSLDVNTSVRVAHPTTLQTTFQTSNAFAWLKKTNQTQGTVNVYDTTNNYLSWYDWITYDANNTFHSYGGNLILPTQNTPASFFGRSELNKSAYFSPFMQELYLNNKSGKGNNHKRLSIQEQIPINDANDMAGDIVLKSISAEGNTILGWRKTANAMAGKWEAINFNGTKVNNQVGTNYTLTSTDLGQTITFNNKSNIILNVPTGLPEGFNCKIIQVGMGIVSVKAAGTKVNNANNFTRSSGQFASFNILMYAPDVFLTEGKMQ